MIKILLNIMSHLPCLQQLSQGVTSLIGTDPSKIRLEKKLCFRSPLNGLEGQKNFLFLFLFLQSFSAGSNWVGSVWLPETQDFFI